MLLNVYNKDTASREQIEASALDTKIHRHVNTHAEFSQEDLERFGVAPQKAAKKEAETK